MTHEFIHWPHWRAIYQMATCIAYVVIKYAIMQWWEQISIMGIFILCTATSHKLVEIWMNTESGYHCGLQNKKILGHRLCYTAFTGLGVNHLITLHSQKYMDTLYVYLSALISYWTHQPNIVCAHWCMPMDLLWLIHNFELSVKPRLLSFQQYLPFVTTQKRYFS